LELRAIEYDADGEPRLYRVGPPTPAKVLTWTDGDICVCGVKCAKHWNADGDWLGCEKGKDAMSVATAVVSISPTPAERTGREHGTR